MYISYSSNKNSFENLHQNRSKPFFPKFSQLFFIVLRVLHEHEEHSTQNPETAVNPRFRRRSAVPAATHLRRPPCRPPLIGAGHRAGIWKISRKFLLFSKKIKNPLFSFYKPEHENEIQGNPNRKVNFCPLPFYFLFCMQYTFVSKIALWNFVLLFISGNFGCWWFFVHVTKDFGFLSRNFI